MTKPKARGMARRTNRVRPIDRGARAERPIAVSRARLPMDSPAGEVEEIVKQRPTSMVLVAAAWIALGVPLAAQDSAETLREQEKARLAERAAQTRRVPAPVASETFLGASDNLFVGVDDTTVSTFLIDPDDNATAAAFMGFEVWGAAVIPDAIPGDAVVYFNDGADLYRWAFPSPPALCCTMMFNAAAVTMVSMTYDAVAGELLFTRNIATEAVYSLPVTAAACPATCDVAQDIVYSSGDNDFGGIAFDAGSGILYGTNDDGTPGPAGVYEINGDGTTSLVVAYPAGETDIDGLAFADGRLYLVTDEPGDIYVYNVGTASFEAPLTNPWASSELFCGAAAGEGLIVPVELQHFSIE